VSTNTYRLRQVASEDPRLSPIVEALITAGNNPTWQLGVLDLLYTTVQDSIKDEAKLLTSLLRGRDAEA